MAFDTTILQVIHHLEAASATGDFPKLRQFISECFRVLKPDGCLLINVHTPEQATSKVMWYNSLLPEASKRQASRYILVYNSGNIMIMTQILIFYAWEKAI